MRGERAFPARLWRSGRPRCAHRQRPRIMNRRRRRAAGRGGRKRRPTFDRSSPRDRKPAFGRLPTPGTLTCLVTQRFEGLIQGRDIDNFFTLDTRKHLGFGLGTRRRKPQVGFPDLDPQHVQGRRRTRFPFGGSAGPFASARMANERGRGVLGAASPHRAFSQGILATLRPIVRLTDVPPPPRTTAIERTHAPPAGSRILPAEPPHRRNSASQTYGCSGSTRKSSPGGAARSRYALDHGAGEVIPDCRGQLKRRGMERHGRKIAPPHRLAFSPEHARPRSKSTRARFRSAG